MTSRCTPGRARPVERVGTGGETMRPGRVEGMEYVLLHKSHGAMCAQLKKYAQLRVIGTVVRRDRERVLVQFDAPGERPTRHWVKESRLTPYDTGVDPLEGQVTLRPSASFAEVSAFALGRVPKAARPTRREQTTGGAPPAATSPRPVRSAPVAPEAAASVPVPPVAGASAPVPPGLRSPALTVRPVTGLPTEPVTHTSEAPVTPPRPPTPPPAAPFRRGQGDTP